MISFIHCGSEKIKSLHVFRWQQVADGRKEIAIAIWVHSYSLIKNLTPFEDDAGIRLLNFLMYVNSQKILLSGWLHSKFISTLKFLSNRRPCFELSHRSNIT